MSRKKFAALFFIVAAFFLVAYFYARSTLPNISRLKTENPQTTAFMQRYKGSKPLEFYWVPYTAISPHLKSAIIVAEDSNFFSHSGVDWGAIWEAFKKNLEARGWKWGGSTVTQQLAKNLFLSPSKHPIRKLKEFLIAEEMERSLTKQRILEIYLNVVEWGEGVYGAEAAARHNFNIPAAFLSPAQAAHLAAMLPSPRYFEKTPDSEHLDQRTLLILKRMGY